MKFRLLVISLILLFGVTSNANTKQIYPDTIKTPIDLTIFFQSYFVYQVDEGGEFKKPKETLRDRGGDCEDYAIFTCHVLRKLGYKCKMIGMWFDEGAHAIAVFREHNGTLSIFDNGFYYRTTHVDIRPLITEGYPDWNVMVYFIRNSPLFYKWKINKLDR